MMPAAMNQLYFIIGFVTAVSVTGLFVFFWWRRTYGVWAHRRRQRDAELHRDATIVRFTEPPQRAKL
jgi:hypothetical protein